MEESTRTHRGLGGMAESRPAGRAESNGGGDQAVSIRVALRRYYAALQREPAAVLVHGEVTKILPADA